MPNLLMIIYTSNIDTHRHMITEEQEQCTENIIRTTNDYRSIGIQTDKIYIRRYNTFISRICRRGCPKKIKIEFQICQDKNISLPNEQINQYMIQNPIGELCSKPKNQFNNFIIWTNQKH